MTNAALRHHRDGDRFFNLNDQLGIAHAGNAALRADIGRHALQRHYRRRSRLFRDARLLRVHHVANYPALQHLWKCSLNLYCSCLFLHNHSPPGLCITFVPILSQANRPRYSQL